ncbi:MAG: phenylalanine--tRNA ligase subunit beta [Candidatus Dasytiphilus stammeri]
MKVSEFWLREWVNPNIDSETLYEQLALLGLEVDSLVTVAGNCTGIIVGEIIECEYADSKLKVTKVDIGSGNFLNILCSASNCRQGIKVVVATIGARLPSNLKIKVSKMPGTISKGMLCSLTDLGLGEEDDQEIIELPVTAPLGINIREYLQLDDKILEINVTPNRADCLSIRGIARDLAAVNKLTLNEPQISPATVKLNDKLPIDVEAASACPRYLTRILKGVNVKVATPLWLSEKLRRCDLLSGNVMINITNYILLELGQPMQTFDLEKIDIGIRVRLAQPNEILRLMEDTQLKLQKDTLVIADHTKVLSIAGIISGIDSIVTDQTKNVLLESAFLDPFIMKHSLQHYYSLQTPASQRYERGVDPMLQYKALERATSLLLDICGGQVGPIIEISNGAWLPKSTVITLRREKIDILLGQQIDTNEVVDILYRLGCKINYVETQKLWKVIPPSWRFDLTIEEDLVEEVARIYGYHKLPCVSFKNQVISNRNHSKTKISLQRIRTLLVDKGYQEVITYSFVNPRMQNILHPSEKSLKLESPMSVEMSAMRLSLWSGLLSAVAYNQNRQQKVIRLFEIGLRFVPDLTSKIGLRQDLMLAGVMSGINHEEHWDVPCKSVDFYDLKGDLEVLLDLTGKIDEIHFKAEMHPALHPGQSATIYLGHEPIGIIGVINPIFERRLELNGRTVLFELLWNRISDYRRPIIQKISSFPSTRRDLAVVIAEDIPASEVLKECKQFLENPLVAVKLFDVYRGHGIAHGYKSLGISLILQETRRTLKESEILAIVAKCTHALKKRFKASLRS